MTEEKWAMTRKLRKIGGSISINLPPMFVKENKLRGGQLVTIEFDHNTLTILPNKPKEKPKE